MSFSTRTQLLILVVVFTRGSTLDRYCPGHPSSGRPRCCGVNKAWKLGFWWHQSTAVWRTSTMKATLHLLLAESQTGTEARSKFWEGGMRAPESQFNTVSFVPVNVDLRKVRSVSIFVFSAVSGLSCGTWDLFIAAHRLSLVWHAGLVASQQVGS